MKITVRSFLFALLLATPLAAQTYDQSVSYPSGTCTANPSSVIALNRYTRSAVSKAYNTVQCTGVFNGNVTGTVAIQYQDLYLLNQQYAAEGKVAIADTFYYVNKTWPVWTPNPNCTISYYTTYCPVGQNPYIISEPIPTSTTISSSVSGSRCFRSVSEVTWRETFRYPWRTYTYTRSSKANGPWTGSGCAM